MFCVRFAALRDSRVVGGADEEAGGRCPSGDEEDAIEGERLRLPIDEDEGHLGGITFGSKFSSENFQVLPRDFG